MSPPIDIDGSEIQRATIDGEDVSEITIDGQQTARFFDIPDSVIHRWPFDEGSGSTVADTVGGTVGSFIDSPTWLSNPAAIGDSELSFDGSNDAIKSPATGGSNAGLTLYQTIDFGSSITSGAHIQELNQNFNAGDCYLRISRNNVDELLWAVQNDSSNERNVTHQLPSTGRYRIAVFLDASNDELGIAVNGDIKITSSKTGGFTSAHDGQHSIGFDNVSNQRFFPAIIDEPMIQNRAATSSEIQNDYNRQPWS